MKIIELTDRVLFLDDIIQIYKEGHYYYVITKNGTYNIYESDYFKIKNYLLSLNDEVEILEEEKKIPEKLSTWYSVEIKQSDEENVEYANYNFETMFEKINEICDYLKSKGE